MYSNSGNRAPAFSRPVVLTSAETKRVAGGLIKNDNSGPGTAPYNMPGFPGPDGGDGGASVSPGSDEPK
jgi:hypothetical protein